MANSFGHGEMSSNANEPIHKMKLEISKQFVLK